MTNSVEQIEALSLNADMDDIAGEVDEKFCDDNADLVNILIVVGSQDPLDPRWTSEQRELIAKASSMLDNFRS